MSKSNCFSCNKLVSNWELDEVYDCLICQHEFREKMKALEPHHESEFRRKSQEKYSDKYRNRK